MAKVNVKSWRAINGFVFVTPMMQSEKTKGGIFIPDSVREPLNIGKVESNGPGTKDAPTQLKGDEYVIYPKHNKATQSLLINGEEKEFFVMYEKDIYAVATDVEIEE